MSSIWWSLLNLSAWGFGLKAVLDLRTEWVPRARTSFLVLQAVMSCLTMEVAMVGAAWVPGLALLSSATGITAAVFMSLALQSMRLDERGGSVATLGGSTDWDRVFAGAALVGMAGSVAVGRLAPQAVAAVAAALHPVEGAFWLAVSTAILVSLFRLPHATGTPSLLASRTLAFAFAFALADSLAEPLAVVAGIAIPPQVSMLFRTLFILTFVAGLYGTVIRLRGHKLVEALNRLRTTQEQLFGVEKMAVVSNMAAGAAHDFNNSLMAITGHLSLALECPGLPEEARDDIEGANRAAMAASSITAGLLGVARRSPGSHAGRSLRAAVQDPLDLLRHDLRRHQIEVQTHLEDPPMGTIDTSMVSQVCLNLFLNARDAMVPKGSGTLDVSLAGRDGEVEISVRDTGVGIPADFEPRLFQPLQTTKGDRGTGLGLSSSQSVVASMGGRITYETVSQQGTTFHVYLPVTTGGAQGGKRWARP